MPQMLQAYFQPSRSKRGVSAGPLINDPSMNTWSSGKASRRDALASEG